MKSVCDSGNLAAVQLAGPWQIIIHNCQKHLSFSLSPNQQNSGQDFSPDLPLFIMIFHTMLEPNGCGDNLFLKSINLDRFSTIFCYTDVKRMHESL